MPDVPGLENNSPKFAQQVPGVQFPYRGEATREGQAYENLGQSVEGAAHTAGEIYDGIQLQHDISTSSKAALDMKVSHDQMVSGIKNDSPDGFVYDSLGAVHNSDDSQMTIAQKYWGDADQDYQQRQQDMSPRAAAMFRIKAQEVIGTNTQLLQHDQLSLQNKYSEGVATDMKETIKKGFDTNLLPTNSSSQSAYVTAPGPNGSTKEYPSLQNLYSAIETLHTFRQQSGPSDDRPIPGLSADAVPQAQKTDADELTHSFFDKLKTDIVDSSGSRAKLHQTLKDASSTATMQIYNALDILDGRDPESLRRAAMPGPVKLPTANSSLTAAHVLQLRNEFLGMIPAAKEVDKSEYELQHNQLDEFSKGVRSMDELLNSPIWQKTTMMGKGLGIPDAKRVQDLASAASNGITASAISATTGLGSIDSIRAAGAAAIAHGEKLWVQNAQMMGQTPEETAGFGQAISTAAKARFAEKIADIEKQRREDPVGFMTKLQEGPQGARNTPVYNSPTMHTIDQKLDPHIGDPGMHAIFGPMTGGKSIIETAQATANNGYSRMFHSQGDVSILSNPQFEDQAKRLVQARDPYQITEYFNKLNQQTGLTDANKEKFIQDLVHKGNLPQTYVDALTNLRTRSEVETRLTELQAGAPDMPEGMTSKQNEADFQEHNKNLLQYLALKAGPNSSAFKIAQDTYKKSWMADQLKAMGPGREMSQSDAANYADEQRNKTTSDIGVVQGQHDFFGTGWAHWGSTGKSSIVEYGSNKYTPEEKQNINDYLLFLQSKENLAKHEIVRPPGAPPPNLNEIPDSENAANRASMWVRIGGGWRLQVMETDQHNRNKGKLTDLRVSDGNGFIEATDAQAKAGVSKNAQRSVAPPTRDADYDINVNGTAYTAPRPGERLQPGNKQ